MTAELQDLNGSIYDDFGATLAVDGDLAVIGATHHQNGNGATGAAYIYKRQGSNWVEEEKLVAEDLEARCGNFRFNGASAVSDAGAEGFDIRLPRFLRLCMPQ